MPGRLRPGQVEGIHRMRALQFHEYGKPDVLRWTDAPDVHAGPGQVRIAVRAASVNPLDWKVFSGAMAGGEPLAGTGYLGYHPPGGAGQGGGGGTGGGGRDGRF